MMDQPVTVVQASNLWKFYNGSTEVAVRAVAGVNLHVKQGEILFISGPNGSGKTTLLSTLGGLTEPSRGCINIMGTEINRLKPSERAAFRLKNIGFIFQTFRLIDALKVIENVELSLNLAGIRRPESLTRAEKLLKELQISHKANSFAHSLSSGEKQRVAIARALANDPALLLADEPTGSLDSQAGQHTIQLLCQTAAKRNKTVIIVSHDERIRHCATRILRMEDGKIYSQN